MYLPKFNQETDTAVLRALIKSKPLGTWSTLADGEIIVNHIPFILNEDEGDNGTLVCHVARANKVWQQYSRDVESVIVFQGDQAYISPSWYPSKHKHGKAVPTWNYIVVQARGIPEVIDDADKLLRHLNELTDTHEQTQELPWKVSDAPEDFIEQMMSAIVCIEIPVSRLTGKWKLGQNRPEPDQLGMVAGLSSSENAQSLGLAQVLNQHIQGNARR